MLNLLFFFFFQAEDGIRDGRVTGVQTCALPIFDRAAEITQSLQAVREQQPRREQVRVGPAHFVEQQRCFDTFLAGWLTIERSEERRVGKECRSGWARYQ